MNGASDPRVLYRGVENTSVAEEPNPDSLPRQGALPELVERQLVASEPLVDVDIGDVHVRRVRPETEVVVQQDDHVTAVAIRALKR